MADSYRKFTITDAVCWKLLPSKFGCGNQYLWTFKNSWVEFNRQNIINAAHENNIPAFLLAGVAYREVGGKDFTDWPVFFFRSFDWSGPDWVDSNFTITSHPAYTSMGAVSIQLRRYAEIMGLDYRKLTQRQLTELAADLQGDTQNLKIVAKHLHQLILIDYPDYGKLFSTLTDEQIKIVATRYYWGPDRSFESITAKAQKDDSYGTFILRHKQHLQKLLRQPN